jgi:thymidylate kinase
MRSTFEALNAAAIGYVVLRGYDPLSELAASADVDLFIPREDLEQAAGVLRACGWRRRRFQTGRYPHVFFDRWADGRRLVRSLDVVTGIHYGRQLHELRGARAIILEREWSDGVAVPAPWMAAFAFALHILLDKEGLSPNNRDRAARMVEACRACPDGRSRLARAFGADAPAVVEALHALGGAAGPAEIGAAAAAARRLGCLRSRRLLATAAAARAWAVNFARPVARVALHGPDGSGKSTLIEALRAAPGTLRVRRGYLGNNEYLTPPGRWLQARLSGWRAAGRDRTLAYRVAANLHALWWPFELRARMALAEHRADVVVYDRYPFSDDVGARAPTTPFGRIMARYRAIGRALLPAPDVAVLLDGDPRVLWERKQEYSFEVFLRVQQAYRDLHASLRVERATVATDGDVETTCAALRRALAGSAAIGRKLYRDG